MEILALALIAFAVISVQAFLFRRFAFKKLEYKCEFSVNEAHEGDDIYLVETAYNGKLLPVPWLKVELNSSRWLDFAGTRSILAQEKLPLLNQDESLIIQCMGYVPCHIDDLLYKTGLDLGLIISILLKMELEGIVKCLPGNYYVKI